jgi:hypothetical protein
MMKSESFIYAWNRCNLVIFNLYKSFPFDFISLQFISIYIALPYIYKSFPYISSHGVDIHSE